MVNMAVASRNVKVQLRFTEFTIIYTMAKIICVALLCYMLKTSRSLLLKPAIYWAYAYIWLWSAVAVVGYARPWHYKFSILQIIIGSIVRHCATSRKVAGSIPEGVIGIFHWHNPSGRTMALSSTQPLTEMSTRNIS